MPLAHIAVDTGGTFTDCVYFAGDRLQTVKLSSTPADPGQAVLTAVRQITGDAPVEVRHGTTVGTNALLERKGARVAFVTTAGFEDTIAIGRQARSRLYDLHVAREKPLVLPELCFGIDERVNPDGSIYQELDRHALSAQVEAIRLSAPESVAVSLLFSFANSAHERAVADALAPLGIPISLSSQILPEFREYERGSTVLINAYLAPRMKRYIEGLDAEFTRSGSRLHVMQSTGGILPAALAAREPVRTILSGPAGGVVGAIATAQAAGFDRILAFDMGGTSTDVALVDGTEGLRTTTESQIAGMPVAVPMLRIHTVGAGGGSLASFDRGGVLKVGPASAGAIPGPVCFGRGSQPTVTDADLVLGRLETNAFLGGGMKLDERRARQFLDHTKGDLPDVECFADGIVRLANAHMEQALRQISVEEGRDPRDFTLVAFGGAGPLHACSLAEGLRIPRVLVPPLPGALSAYGILISDFVRDYSRTVMLPPDSPQLEVHFADIEQSGREELRREQLFGSVSRSLDLRYVGQGFELAIDAGPDVVSRFHQSHASRYGYSDPKRPVEVVNVRVRLTAATDRIALPVLLPASDDPIALRKKSIYSDGQWLEGAVYDRDTLRAGHRLSGPAVLVEYTATTFVPPGWSCQVHPSGALLLEPLR